MFKLFLSLALLSLTSLYDLSLPDAAGGTISLSNFRGKKILLVNIATSSRYTSQLASLEQLYQKFKDSLVIIAVPSNSFGHEPRDNSQIEQYLSSEFGVHVIVAGKANVAGSGQHPVFDWLTHRAENTAMDNTINNDFWKFLIDERGHLIGAFVSSVDPMSNAVQTAVQTHN
jgi:glutathione peroxidase